MNLLILANLMCLVGLNLAAVAERLYHREGRFIDLAINKYKTQLPSIHDIANTFIHYRMPIAVFVPTVRLNIRPKQKRTQYASFPTPPKKPDNQASVQDTQQNKLPAINEQENQMKSNKQDLIPSNNIISRQGWTARSLNKPKRYFTLSNHKLRAISEQARRGNLNYAGLPEAESNVDLIPFLYKDNLPNDQNLFNSHYQLTNSNPNHVFSQNIAYIQPNSLPFQPNILLLSNPSPNQPVQSVTNQGSISNQALVNNQSISNQNNTLPVNSTISQSITLPDQLSVSQSISGNVDQIINKEQVKPVSESVVNNSSSDSTISQFDTSQISENPDEIGPESVVQNHEPIDANVPVNPISTIEESVNNSVSNPINNENTVATNLSNNSINNVTTMISNSSSNPVEQPIERQFDSQPVAASLINNDSIFIYPYRTNFIRQLNSNPVYQMSQIKPKNLMSNRAHRSLPVDMTSVASLFTAAAAQSGHRSSEDRRLSFTKFLNDNYN